MKRRNRSTASLLREWVGRLGLAATLVTLIGCGPDSHRIEVTPETIVIDGSSTVFPISREAADRFMRDNPDARIAVRFSGTTAGFQKLLNQECDVVNASRAINEEERAAAAARGIDLIELPLANDALALVVNPANRWLESLTLADLKKIWSPESEGRVMQWSDVRADWPQRPMKLYGRGKSSGTLDYFSEKVTGRAREIRSDYFSSEDEEVLAGKISRDREALGFFGIGAYHRHWNTLRVVSIDAGEGPVYPSLETVESGTYTPFTRRLFLYVNRASLKAKPELLPFLRHYHEDLPAWLHFTGFLPQSPQAREQARATLDGLGDL